MKKNRTKKIILMIIMFLMFSMFIILPNSNADEWDDLYNAMNGVQNTPTGGTKTSKVMQIVINLIRSAGAGIAIITVTIVGIKYMLASPDDKAELKKKLIPLAIGLVLLVSAAEIIIMVGDVAQSL